MNDNFFPHELPWFPAVQTFPLDPKTEPYALNKAEVLAIKALQAGNANSDQQQRALRAIIHKLCGTYDQSFRPGPDGDRATAFAEGKRFIGTMIVRAVNLSMPVSGDDPNAQRHPQPEPGARRKPAKRAKPGTSEPGKQSVE